MEDCKWCLRLKHKQEDWQLWWINYFGSQSSLKTTHFSMYLTTSCKQIVFSGIHHSLDHIYGWWLGANYSISTANALEIQQSCTNPSIYSDYFLVTYGFLEKFALAGTTHQQLFRLLFGYTALFFEDLVFTAWTTYIFNCPNYFMDFFFSD